MQLRAYYGGAKVLDSIAAQEPKDLVTYKSAEDLVKQTTPGAKERTASINARVPEDTRDGLDETARLWAMQAEARGEPSAHIDRTFVIRRLLKNGIDGVFQSFGGRPQDDSAWQAIANKVVENSGR